MIVNGTSLLGAAPIKNMLSYQQRLNGVSHGLAEVGYDIRIKQELKFFPYANGIHINDRFQAGKFILASAIEEFDMPNHLVGIVHDKSTWARHGLSVFNTVIEPGWKGFLTLELVYHGSKTLVIPAGSGIAQVVFHQISCTASYAGSYQNQADEPVPSLVV